MAGPTNFRKLARAALRGRRAAARPDAGRAPHLHEKSPSASEGFGYATGCSAKPGDRVFS